MILGRKTFEWVVKNEEIPHQEKQTYVITRNPKPSAGNLHFYSGDLSTLIAKLKSENVKNIFCDGGAEVVNTILSRPLKRT